MTRGQAIKNLQGKPLGYEVILMGPKVHPGASFRIISDRFPMARD